MNYSKEFKDAILRRMLPPNNESISKIASQEVLSEQTLRNWREKARKQGYAAPGTDAQSDNWNTQDKFLIVVETASKGTCKRGKGSCRNSSTSCIKKKSKCDFGGSRGRMISASDRSEAVQLIDEATASGAKRSNACSELGITERTFYRWCSQIKEDGETQDQRPVAERQCPKNKITDIERQRIINTSTRRFKYKYVSTALTHNPLIFFL